MSTEFGKLTLTVDQQAIQKLIAEGRLFEFTNSLAKLASEQIPAQVVDHLVKASSGAREASTAAPTAEFALVLEEGGGFGTRPHLPHGPIVHT